MENEVTKIDKDGNESVVTMSYKIKSIDSARFIATSLSNLVDNLTEGILKIKCKDCNCFFNMKLPKKIKQNVNLCLAIMITQTELIKN